MGAGLYGAVIGENTPPDALLSRIEFLEDHLTDMGEDARDAEHECWRRPNDPAARARLEVIYMTTRAIRATIEALTCKLPADRRPQRREREKQPA